MSAMTYAHAFHLPCFRMVGLFFRPEGQAPRTAATPLTLLAMSLQGWRA
ncbi:hypothetical protein [Pseudoprimorskyibacter insulae]|uniref:Uncharacterized protein n=1 Tax=Pseudoprimorskyibacter insulae TaxID=1695997 RepID=A0A2R8B035_9RHOB|nr:hypothetical protein [Pseudoprimorskyibacter insulae]SPF81620.1 hypothetical protein PRI8871_03445 [Pseudoprimorskyibacter insulae]